MPEYVLLSFCLFITLMGWGAWGIFDKKALSIAGPVSVLVALYTYSIPIALITGAVYFGGGRALPVTAAALTWTGLSALSVWTGRIFNILALSRAEASYVLGFTASYPVVMQLLAVPFLGESLVPARIAGAALIYAGMIVIGTSRTQEPKEKQNYNYFVTVLFLILATLCWGFTPIINKLTVQLIRPFSAFFMIVIWEIVIWLICLPFVWKLKIHHELAERRVWFLTGLSAVSLAGGGAAILVALSLSTASYVIVISACYPLVMYLFAMLFLNEDFNLRRFLGIALIVLGGGLAQSTHGI